MKNQGKKEYSFEQAVNLLKNDSSVYQAVFLKSPGMILDLAKQDATVGVSFGRYPQGEDGEVSPIEWEVISIESGRALLISKNGLDAIPYNKEMKDVTWETCTLRSWLNSTFLNTAFSAEEQAMIPTVTVSADANPKYRSFPGNDTRDQVFLLSIPEANKYFSSRADRQCVPTVYAKAQGCKVFKSGFCLWWLRSPGDVQRSAARVYDGGSVDVDGDLFRRDDHAVRPALWINLES